MELINKSSCLRFLLNILQVNYTNTVYHFFSNLDSDLIDFRQVLIVISLGV